MTKAIITIELHPDHEMVVSAIAALKARNSALAKEPSTAKNILSAESTEVSLHNPDRPRKRRRLSEEDSPNIDTSILNGHFKKLDRLTGHSNGSAHESESESGPESAVSQTSGAETADGETEEEGDDETEILNSISNELKDVVAFPQNRPHRIGPSKIEVAPVQLSTVEPGRMTYNADGSLCVKMLPTESLLILGQYDLWVKRGVVSLLGASLTAGPTLHRVFAPMTHSLPPIKCISGEYFVSEYAELEIRSCTSGLERLKNVSPLYDAMWNESSGPPNSVTSPRRLSYSVLFEAAKEGLNRLVKRISISPPWLSVISMLSGRDAKPRSRILSCGPKSSGKSTFNRLLVNSLLSNHSHEPRPETTAIEGVCYLDLDPGQPEYAPPGNVYLAYIRSPNFGPPFSHPISPSSSRDDILRMHHIGSVTPGDDQAYYVSCAQDLLRHYYMFLEMHPSCPLIINSSGWIHAAGLEVLIELITHLDPTDVVYMNDKGPAEILEPIAETIIRLGIRLHTLPSQPTEFVTRSAAQLRTMQNISYFHTAAMAGSEQVLWNHQSIDVIDPLVVEYAGPRQGILGVLVSGGLTDSDLLYDAIDGSVVGVIALEEGLALEDDLRPEADGDSPTAVEDKAFEITSKSTAPNAAFLRTKGEDLPYITARMPPDPSNSRCLGLALVRSINVAAKTLELSTPIPRRAILSCLENDERLVLVKGKLEVPDWALAEQHHAAMTRGETGPVAGPWVKVTEEDNPRLEKGGRIWKVEKGMEAGTFGSDIEMNQ